MEGLRKSKARGGAWANATAEGTGSGLDSVEDRLSSTNRPNGTEKDETRREGAN